jgi:hypothetical protein
MSVHDKSLNYACCFDLPLIATTAITMDEIAAAAELMVPALPAVDDEIEAAVQAAAAEVADAEVKSEEPETRRIHRAKALTPKQAYTKFWNRGIFVIYNEDLDLEKDDEEIKNSRYIVRCRCSPACKTSFATWDNYAYTRHFTYKRHEKWESARAAQGWDEGEAYRDFVKFIESTMDEEEEEVQEPKKKRGRKSKKDSTSKKTVPKGPSRQEERRNQEMHYMNLWREARSELQVMRKELKEEHNEEAAEELRGDIAGLKKKKEEWAKLLGIEGCDV